MPISPQIVITPEDISFKSFDISAVSYTSDTATYTATGHTLSLGDVVTITGLAPDGYNGTYTISSIAADIFTVSNTTDTALTDQAGNVYWADPEDYEYDGGQTVTFIPNDDDVNDLVDTNETVAAAIADAEAAAAAAAIAQADAATAYATAVAANTAASVAQATANGKNKVTYSTSTPGSTANSVGDIWYQYGTTSPNVGRIIAQYSGAGGTSWTQTTISGLVVANIDAGNITTGTLTAAVGISNPSGNFSVNGATGALVATSATITGTVNAQSGYFGTASNGWSISSSSLVGVGTGTIVGGQISGTLITGSLVRVGTTKRVELVQGPYTGSLSFWKTTIGYIGHIVPLDAFGILMHYGGTADPSGGTFPQMYVGSTVVSMFSNNTHGISVSAIDTTIIGDFVINGKAFAPNLGTSSSATNLRVATGSIGEITETSASSIRFKENVVDVFEVFDINPKKLLDLPVRGFTWKEDYLNSSDDRVGIMVPGFIAEEVDAVYPVAVDYEQDGPITWNDRFIVPGLLALIQDQEARIKKLEGE